MEKEIIYKGKKIKMEVKWSGTAYCISIDGRGFKALTRIALMDLNQLKKEIIYEIENKGDLALINDWDGNLDSI